MFTEKVNQSINWGGVGKDRFMLIKSLIKGLFWWGTWGMCYKDLNQIGLCSVPRIVAHITVHGSGGCVLGGELVIQ